MLTLVAIVAIPASARVLAAGDVRTDSVVLARVRRAYVRVLTVRTEVNGLQQQQKSHQQPDLYHRAIIQFTMLVEKQS